jgi:hypothetical protein
MNEDDRREIGRLLYEARKTLPRSGVNARAWSEACALVGVNVRTAARYVRLYKSRAGRL